MREVFGTAVASSSNCLGAESSDEPASPVTLPPGRARLATRPAATGSVASGNTICTVRVSRNKGPTVEVPVARMTSGPSATNSAAYLRVSSVSNLVHRVSIRIFRPVIQPDCASPCRNAPTRIEFPDRPAQTAAARR
jgi:hypothetical protein